MPVMMHLAGQAGPGPGPFLLTWSLLAMGMGGALATKKWSARFRDFIAAGLEGRPEPQQKANRFPPQFTRAFGAVFALAGAIAMPISVVMINRH